MDDDILYCGPLNSFVFTFVMHTCRLCRPSSVCYTILLCSLQPHAVHHVIFVAVFDRFLIIIFIIRGLAYLHFSCLDGELWCFEAGGSDFFQGHI